MQGDLISRDFSVKALREYAEQKHAVGQTELANGILKAINFLQKEENVPTAYDVEKVIEKMDEVLYDRCYSYEYNLASKEMEKVVRNGGKE